MDCSQAKYHENNEVVGYFLHRGSNQLFMTNWDKTISPVMAPNRYWGYKNDGLRLVLKDDADKLIFDKLVPSNIGI